MVAIGNRAQRSLLCPLVQAQRETQTRLEAKGGEVSVRWSGLYPRFYSMSRNSTGVPAVMPCAAAYPPFTSSMYCDG